MSQTESVESVVAKLTPASKSSPATPSGAKDKRGHRSLVGTLFDRLGMLPVLIVMYVLVYALTIYFSEDGTSNFLSTGNTMNILRQVAINLVLAAGMTFVILTAGIDLSVGSILAVSAVLGMLVSLPGAAPNLALPTFLLVGLAAGMLNGA